MCQSVYVTIVRSRLYHQFLLVVLPTDLDETVKQHHVDLVKNASAKYATHAKNHEIVSKLFLSYFFTYSQFADSINRMAYVRANNEANECIIENYQVLKLEKYVLETQELDARKTENEFRNRNKKLKAEVTLKRKHHAEASSHYALCIAQLDGSEKQLKECEQALEECQKSCTIPAKYTQFDRYRRLSFKMKKFYLNDLKDVLSCPEWNQCDQCLSCPRGGCSKCPRCV